MLEDRPADLPPVWAAAAAATKLVRRLRLAVHDFFMAL
jgi:hypothetical protein